MRDGHAGDASMPELGFGTWELRGQVCYRSVRHALEVGYRHVDTAEIYRNEDAVGRALADSGVARDELWVTTKVWRRHLSPDALPPAVEGSLQRLRSDYVDLLLIHWPSRRVPLGATLEAMLALRDRGLVRHLGVSNFPSRLLEEAVGLAPILTDQVEYHPYLGQKALLETARHHGVVVTAYSPLAQGRVVGDAVLAEIAEACGATPAQVALAWLLRKEGVAAIPRSASPAHIEQNLAALDVTLDDEQVARIDGLERGERLTDPAFAPDWD